MIDWQKMYLIILRHTHDEKQARDAVLYLMALENEQGAPDIAVWIQ